MRRLSFVLCLVLLVLSPAGSTAQASQSPTSQAQRDAFGTLLEASARLKCPNCAAHITVSGTALTIHLPQVSADQFNEQSSALQGDAKTVDFLRGYGFTKFTITNDGNLSRTDEIGESSSQAVAAPPVTASTSSPSPQPFGFSEGLTKQQITALVGGGAVKKIDGDVMTVTDAPKPNSFFDEYLLVVSPTEGLVKVLASGKAVETGDSGGELRSNFQEIVDGVSQKYSAPTKTFDFCNGGTGCGGPEFWMLSLQEKNRTLAASWDSERIFVQAYALGMNSGYVLFSMEFPDFSAYVNRKKAEQNNTF